MARSHTATAGAGGEGSILAVVRAADVLTYFTHSPARSVGVTEVAAALGLSKAVVFRILSSLRDRGYVAYDDVSRRYFLGTQSLLLGLACLDRSDLRSMARELLTQLSAATRETATLSVRTGWERIYIDQATPDRDIKMVVPIGRPFPLHAGSSSKAFLAFLPAVELDRFFGEVPARVRLTPATIVNESDLRAELAAVRARGYAMSRGERQPDAASVAAPVFDRTGTPAAVMSVCGPIDRFAASAEAALEALLRVTTQLSRQLAHTG